MGLVLLALAGLMAGRALLSQGGPPLEAWHTGAPDELRAAALDAADWPAWLVAEDQVFQQVAAMSAALPPHAHFWGNRYFTGSPNHPPRFARDWNRSFVLEPAGAVRGAVVLLHGLTDTPYSVRYVAEEYRARGFVAIGMRMPGHGTVPAGLTRAVWEDWAAATRLAMRHARLRAGPGLPLHLVGYSNGGALALMQALTLGGADRLVLISPMVGVSAFARFAGLAAWPALLPAFAPAAWLSVLPEFNPFKYNSFPVNAARQSFRLTEALQARLARGTASLPPVLAFQSVLDSTVSTQAVIDLLFGRLPANGSELVLYDRNRASPLAPLLRPGAEADLDRMLPPAPRNWRLSVVTNAGPGEQEIEERSTSPDTVRRLGLRFTPEIYSLSHVALPFPADDPLYGNRPAQPPEFGVSLGTATPLGETGALITSLVLQERISFNPFFDHLLARVGEGLPPR